MDKENTHRQSSKPEEKNKEREVTTEREDGRKETEETNSCKEEHFHPSTSLNFPTSAISSVPSFCILAREFSNKLRASTKAPRIPTVWLEGFTGSSQSVNNSDTSAVLEAYAKMLTIFIPLLVDDVAILIFYSLSGTQGIVLFLFVCVETSSFFSHFMCFEVPAIAPSRGVGNGNNVGSTDDDTNDDDLIIMDIDDNDNKTDNPFLDSSHCKNSSKLAELNESLQELLDGIQHSRASVVISSAVLFRLGATFQLLGSGVVHLSDRSQACPVSIHIENGFENQDKDLGSRKLAGSRLKKVGRFDQHLACSLSRDKDLGSEKLAGLTNKFFLFSRDKDLGSRKLAAEIRTLRSRRWAGLTKHLVRLSSQDKDLGSSQEDYNRLRPLSNRGVDVFILAFSLISRASYENLSKKWIRKLRHYAPGIPIVLVRTKLDLREDKQFFVDHPGAVPIITAQGEELKKLIGATAYNECSSKTQ
ncbi:hypothetical protein ACSBR1_030120 [Camellia fascicularis]